MSAAKYTSPKTKLLPSDFGLFCVSQLGVSPKKVSSSLALWLDEDHGAGDVSVWASSWGSKKAECFVIAKQDFVLCGLQLMCEVFSITSAGQRLEIWSEFRDGDLVRKGDTILKATGTSAALLLAERCALNLASKLSGVSTQTRNMLESMKKIQRELDLEKIPQLLETRKTTPGLRLFEKYATRIGGARNHRHGLDTGAMLKENHLRMSASIAQALNDLSQNAPTLTGIEVEVCNMIEFKEAFESKLADVIMLDNFNLRDVELAVQMRNLNSSKVRLELSGNLDEKNLEDILKLGIEYISVGALIHKAKWVDMSLQLFPL